MNRVESAKKETFLPKSDCTTLNGISRWYMNTKVINWEFKKMQELVTLQGKQTNKWTNEPQPQQTKCVCYFIITSPSVSNQFTL